MIKHCCANMFPKMFSCLDAQETFVLETVLGYKKQNVSIFFSEIFYFATLRDKSLTASYRVALDAIHELSMCKHSFQ